MKYFIIVLLLCIVGCDNETITTDITKYDKVCLDGFVYYKISSSYGYYTLTPKFGGDGRPVPCEVKK